MIKILLVNAFNSVKKMETRYSNLGMGYIAAVLRKHFPRDVEIKIIDSRFDAVFKTYQPDLVGIQSITKYYGLAEQIARQAYHAGVPVLIGGPHVTTLPGNLDPSMTLACLGEGEDTIVDLIGLFLDKGSLRPADLEKIQGICFQDGDEMRFTRSRPPIANLDKLPLPARDLLNPKMKTYMLTSRGCPYSCRFCASSRIWGKPRFFSAEYVVNEIETLAIEYKQNFITIYDDMFIGNVKRLTKIVEGLDSRGLLKKIKFQISVAAPNITEEVARLLKEINVVCAGIGFESGSEKVLKYLKGSLFSVESNRQALVLLKKYGITVNGHFIVGSPNETQADLMETYRFIKNNSLNFIGLWRLTPYPGTAIWDYALHKGLVHNGMDWQQLDLNFANGDGIVLNENLMRKEVYHFYRKLKRYQIFYYFKNIWHHPYVKDLPNEIYNYMQQKVWK